MARKQVFSCDTTTEGDVQGKRDIDAYFRLCNTSVMEHFSKIIHDFYPSIIIAKKSVTDVW